MKYQVGQVFKGENEELIITKAKKGLYYVRRFDGTEYKLDDESIDGFMLSRELFAVGRKFEIGDKVFTKNRSIFIVLDYQCGDGYLRGQPETGSPQILKISGLEKYDSASDVETEVEDEMVSLEEVCQVLKDNGESYVADIVRAHFVEKKKKQDPEYKEFLRLKEKFGG